MSPSNLGPAFGAVLALLLALPACHPQSGKLEAPQELPADTHFHALPQTQLGIYAVLLPLDYHAPENRTKTYPLVLILHGHGSTEIRHGKMADTFGRQDVIYLAPRAPYAHERVFIELDTPGWTAMPTVPEQLWEVEEGDADYIDVDRLYTDWIASTIADVRRRYRVSDQRLVIYGHSQGATYAYLFALHHPELVKAYFAFAGYYDFIKDKTPGEGAGILKKHGVFSSLLHNRLDPMVEVSQTERLAAYLEQHGVRHESFISAAGDHYLTDDERTRATQFIRSWCCGAQGSEERTLPPLESKSQPVTAEPGSQVHREILRTFGRKSFSTGSSRRAQDRAPRPRTAQASTEQEGPRQRAAQRALPGLQLRGAEGEPHQSRSTRERALSIGEA